MKRVIFPLCSYYLLTSILYTDDWNRWLASHLFDNFINKKVHKETLQNSLVNVESKTILFSGTEKSVYYYLC